MEQVFYNDKDINTMTTVQLLQSLQQTDKYVGMTQKQIINILGGKSVYLLRPALVGAINVKKSYGPLLPELGPLVSQHLDIFDARLINKASLVANEQRFKEMEKIYKFVANHIIDPQFKLSQKQQIMSLSNYDIECLNLLILKIYNIILLPKIDTIIYTTFGFLFENSKLVLIVSGLVTGFKTIFKKSNNIRDMYLYNFIINHFDESAYNKFYNRVKGVFNIEHTYEDFMIAQSYALSTIDSQTTDLLYYLIYKIENNQLQISTLNNASGFIFFNNKIVIFGI